MYSVRSDNVYKTILLRSAGKSLKHSFIFAPLLTQLNLDPIRIRKNHAFSTLLSTNADKEILLRLYLFLKWRLTQI